MPFRICKAFEVENGHMLSKHPDKCQFPHGHSRKVEFVLESDTLDENEMVCDFKILKEVIQDYLETLDHALCMNTEDPAFLEMRARYGDRIVAFERTDPTTEIMAREVFIRCRQALADYSQRQEKRYPLRSGVKLTTVRLWETSSSWAEYWE